MLGFFSKKKDIEIVSPLTGNAMPITKAPDPVFADKILGDGIAIEPNNGEVRAPADATVVQVAHTFHALGLETASGVELLVHLGIDTVKLAGEGFTCHVKVGQVVKQGDLLMEMDIELIKSKGLSTISPFIITNMDDLKSASFTDGAVIAGQTVVIHCQK